MISRLNSSYVRFFRRNWQSGFLLPFLLAMSFSLQVQAQTQTITYQALTDFNTGRGFSYTTTKNETMVYNSSVGTMKAASEAYLLIGRDYMHPGNLADAVLRFTSPGKGQLAITGRVYDLNSSCGGGTTSGALVTIKRNTKTLSQNTILQCSREWSLELPIKLCTTSLRGNVVEYQFNFRRIC